MRAVYDMQLGYLPQMRLLRGQLRRGVYGGGPSADVRPSIKPQLRPPRPSASILNASNAFATVIAPTQQLPRAIMQHGGGLGALGTAIEDQWFGHVGCSELKPLLIQLQLAVKEAEAKGATSSLAYQQAKKIIDAETGILSRSLFVFGDSCRNGVSTVTSALNDMKAVLGAGFNLNTAEPEKPPSSADWMSLVKWVAIGAAVVGGAYALGPAIRAVTSFLPRRRFA